MDEAWKEFMATGKVVDYLHYKNAGSEQIRQAGVADPQEERPDGTECGSDRNGLSGYADWRI